MYRKIFFLLFISSLFITCSDEPYDITDAVTEEQTTDETDPDVDADTDTDTDTDTDEDGTDDQDGVFTFTDEDGKEYPLGGDCDNGSPDYIPGMNILPDLVILDMLPESFDNSEFLPTIGNQKSQPSCVSWAVTYHLKSLQENLERDATTMERFTMSPAFTYNKMTQGMCTGTSISATLDILQEEGAATLADFPWDEADCGTQPDDAAQLAAEPYKIKEYFSLSGENMVAEMKTLLTQNTPVVISAALSPEFGKTDSFGKTGYRPHLPDYDKSGCHAMLVVGYDDALNAFKTVNSWGSDWGSGGFVYIDYAAFENVADTTADFRVINSAYVAYDLE